MKMTRDIDKRAASDSKGGPASDKPYGTEPRRSLYPLVILIAVFACWFGFMILLALREAALR
jgi:hypothetical protein